MAQNANQNTNELVDGLNHVLANHMVFYQKLRNYHWNVTGPAFFQLHQKFEEMYLRTAEEVDALAERILGLNGRPISTLGGFLERADLHEDPVQEGVPKADTMVGNLRRDIATILERSKELRHKADAAGDDTTVNVLDAMDDMLEQDGWMLRAWLG